MTFFQTRFWLNLWLALSIFTLLWDVSGLDRTVSAWFGTANGFALKNHPLWGTGMYNAQRILAWSVLAVLIFLSIRPRGAWAQMPKRDRGWMLLTIVIGVVTIPILKKFSSTSCPWSLAEFGGVAGVEWVSHWNVFVKDGGPGRCFPSGHSSSALGFIAVPVFLWGIDRSLAKKVLFAVLIAAIWTATTQVIRGAHFVSHNLWTAWLCLSLSLAVHHLTRPRSISKPE